MRSLSIRCELDRCVQNCHTLDTRDRRRPLLVPWQILDRSWYSRLWGWGVTFRRCQIRRKIVHYHEEPVYIHVVSYLESWVRVVNADEFEQCSVTSDWRFLVTHVQGQALARNLSTIKIVWSWSDRNGGNYVFESLEPRKSAFFTEPPGCPLSKRDF